MKEDIGIAASRKNPGIYWVHNDSGDGPEVYGINAQGRYVAKIRMKDIGVGDVEDISIGNCENYGSCIFSLTWVTTEVVGISFLCTLFQNLSSSLAMFFRIRILSASYLFSLSEKYTIRCRSYVVQHSQ